MIPLLQFLASWFALGLAIGLNRLVVMIVLLSFSESEKDYIQRKEFVLDLFLSSPSLGFFNIILRDLAIGCGLSSIVAEVWVDLLNSSIFWPWYVLHIFSMWKYTLGQIK